MTLSETGKQPVVFRTDSFDFPQTPGVEGIKALSQGLGDGPCLTPVEQDWEDVSPVEVQLQLAATNTAYLVEFGGHRRLITIGLCGKFAVVSSRI